MNIVVYTIAKNEAQFAERWARSMSEADGMYVLDTGSDDGTPERLRSFGVQVFEEQISPWRFDAARNRALELLPEDAEVCVSADLDEVFRPGWRAALEKAWRPGTGQASYRYTWSFNPDGSEGCVFWPEKIHARHGYEWVHPVHEVLRWIGPGLPGPTVRAEGVQLDHYPDASKSRAQYLPLLELSVRENPDDDRNVHYLGREYMFYGRWEDCIRTLRRHLSMPSAVWEDERCASMRYIAVAQERLGRSAEARRWRLRAAAEAPHLREPWLDCARSAYREGEYLGALYFAERALAVRERPYTYITEAEAWGAQPWDIAALSAWQLGLKAKALEYGEKAAALSPEDARLQTNLRFYRGEA